MRTIRKCNVAVVGGAGFLGSHLVNHLIEDRDCNVLVVDNLVVGRREFVHPKATFLHHDITGSEERLRRVFKSLKDVKPVRFGFGLPLYVFNYAAYPYIPDSFARPIHVCDINFMGAMKVINAAQEAGAEAILQVSSAEIYGGCIESNLAGTSGRITEEVPVCPHSSYGVAKAAVDNWVQVRWREAKIPCIALRQFNCVGERETHPYIVPEIISQLAAQQVSETKKGEIIYRGPINNAAQVCLGNNSFRDFMYAGDAVKIAVELLERGQFGEVVNLGSEGGTKVYDLAKAIGKLMGFASVEIVEDEARKRPWEIWHLQSCNDKLYSILGEKPVFTKLEVALEKAIKWYDSNGRRWPWE